MILTVTDTKGVAKLFQGWQETLIWSCLQGVMGKVYATENNRSAMAVLGDFCFFAGEVSEELLRFRPEGIPWEFMILTPQNELWGRKIEEMYGEKARKFTRYAIQKEPEAFDRKHLREAVQALPKGYVLREIDEELYERCLEQEWSEDFVAQYRDYDMFAAWGLGIVALKDDEIVCGASSYSSYRGGIEIEVDTLEWYRRQGLAYACCAQLILNALDRGWYPSWDAHNMASVQLAQKLGYHLDHPYTAYEIFETC